MRVACLTLILIFFGAVLGAPEARAASAACSSGYVKDSLDDQIRLYTLCLNSRDLRPGERAWAHGNRGISYLQKGEDDLAMADFGKAIHYDPKFGISYFNRSIIHWSRGDLAAAEADISDAIARPPVRIRAKAYERRGIIRLYEGRCAPALADFDAALKMSRKLAWAHAGRAWVLATCAEQPIRNGTEALKSAQKALSIQDHWKIRDTLAAAYADLGQFEDGARELKLALEMLAADGENASLWQSNLQARLALYEARQPYRDETAEALEAGEWFASIY
jgi:tetratricopeptide (TPR) repeat protein